MERQWQRAPNGRVRWRSLPRVTARLPSDVVWSGVGKEKRWSELSFVDHTGYPGPLFTAVVYLTPKQSFCRVIPVSVGELLLL